MLINYYISKVILFPIYQLLKLKMFKDVCTSCIVRGYLIALLISIIVGMSFILTTWMMIVATPVAILLIAIALVYDADTTRYT